MVNTVKEREKCIRVYLNLKKNGRKALFSIYGCEVRNRVLQEIGWALIRMGVKAMFGKTNVGMSEV